MAQLEALMERLTNRLSHECRRVKELRGEMASLADAYHRYRDLQDEFSARSQSINRLVGTIGPSHFPDVMLGDDTEVIGTTVETAPSVADYREDTSLWEAMRQTLIEAGEMRESELLLFLEYLGFKTSPAAIQSALKTHRETFKVRSERRKKIISLKRGG